MQVLNLDLLKSPMNWALVAFSTILLVFIAHAILGGFTNEQE